MYRLTWAIMTAAKRQSSLRRLCCWVLLTLAAGLPLILLPWTGWVESPPGGILQLEYGSRKPDFAACDFPAPCGPPGMRSFYKMDLLQRVASAATSLVQNGRIPLILQIGAFSLSSDDIFTDQDLFLRVLRLLPDEVYAAIRMVFVEPNALVLSMLRKNIQNLRLSPNKSQIVNAMITDECPAEHFSMYRFGPQAELDFGAPENVYNSWLGPHPAYPLGALKGFARNRASELRTKDNWLAFAAATNLSAYVQEVLVPCMNPSALMTAAGATVADMVMLVIDAEEADLKIVNRFLDMPGFAPAYYQYECIVWNTTSNWDLLPRERRHGFSVGSTLSHGHNHTDSDNCVAIRRQPS